MNKLIKDIITSFSSNDVKLKELQSILDDIEVAKGILSGKYKYCKLCNDYYLAQSFITKEETIESKICVYNDLINSGGNEYRDGFVDLIYEVCPKGHKQETHRYENLR